MMYGDIPKEMLEELDTLLPKDKAFIQIHLESDCLNDLEDVVSLVESVYPTEGKPKYRKLPNRNAWSVKFNVSATEYERLQVLILFRKEE